ncbi:hypothetical protein, partial [Pseudomonas aeruginosa]|uniref:hypothetical protein n=1 Tax=Pseudomonas aeruginosa TaxID=287 RepID=UPI0039825393
QVIAAIDHQFLHRLRMEQAPEALRAHAGNREVRLRDVHLLQPSAYRIAKAVRLLSRVALLEMSTGLPLGHWFPSKLCPRKR